MNLRKSIYFKPLCLLVAALFTGQCVSIEKKLVSTEEKVIEDESQGYVYELEKIKTPSAQDPIVEYRIVKFPANRVETINIYKQDRKGNTFSSMLLGCAISAALGIFIGTSLGNTHGDGDINGSYYRVLIASLTGGIGGLIAGFTIKKKSSLIKEPTGFYLGKKPGSSPIPVQDFPLEFKGVAGGKSIVFKTQTNEQGIARINLIDDLKITKFPPDQPFTLYIHYLNPQSQKNAIFGDSLELEK
ncbi:MAG TPA: hypothetical protein VK469_24670 [Candidatus Kapabacteria bacterium]|nr:hypothetical protein [Candidatus Kapabacteria bacterium]